MVERQGTWLSGQLPQLGAQLGSGPVLDVDQAAANLAWFDLKLRGEVSLSSFPVTREPVFPVRLRDLASKPDSYRSCVPGIVFAQLPRGPPGLAQRPA